MLSRPSELLSLLMLIPTWLILIWQTDLILFTLSMGKYFRICLWAESSSYHWFHACQMRSCIRLLNWIDLNRTSLDTNIMTGKSDACSNYPTFVDHLLYSMLWKRESETNNTWPLKASSLAMNDSEKYCLSFKCIANSDRQANYYCALEATIDKFQTMFQAKAVLWQIRPIIPPWKGCHAYKCSLIT